MPINARSLKPKRRRTWVFFSLSLFFDLFLIVSSLLPGEISSRQSALFSKALSDFLSLFSPGSEAKTMVEPTGLALLSDSTLLPMKNGLPQLAEGTTSLLSFRLDSAKLKQGEYLNPHFEVTRLEGGEEDYLLYTSENANKKYVRIETHRQSEEGKPYRIRVDAGDSLSYEYDFEVIGLLPPDPSWVLLPESLSLGSLYRLDFKREEEGKDNFYFHRYYEASRLEVLSSDPSILSYESPYLFAHKEGEVGLQIGERVTKVKVEGEGSSEAKAPSLRSDGGISRD